MKLRIARSAQAQAITDLRKRAYQKGSKTHLIDDRFLEWNEDDENALILYLTNQNEIPISSIRLSMAFHKKQIEGLFDIRLLQNLEYPMLLLDKLTTAPEYRGRGLSAAMRYFILKSAVNSDVHNIAFTINDGVSRKAHLLELGFHLVKADLSHRLNTTFQNETDVLFGYLPQSQFQNAAKIALQNLKTPWSEFSLAADVPVMMEDFLRVRVEA
ncbi:hypothetical protein [Croceimicrobium sp.]|uniref:hypothetical protein n=1 Tax=Croceimicrobium sp. TaxID=2828340 RepID=UPI003BAC00E8